VTLPFSVKKSEKLIPHLHPDQRQQELSYRKQIARQLRTQLITSKVPPLASA